MFPEFSGEEYENFTKLAQKMRNNYDFGHTLNAKFLPRGDSSVKGPMIRLLKPFDELFADFQVMVGLLSVNLPFYVYDNFVMKLYEWERLFFQDSCNFEIVFGKKLGI